MVRNGNGNLHDSARNKQDEFYTLPADIDMELAHYTSSFSGKVVYCSADDQGSAFRIIGKINIQSGC